MAPNHTQWDINLRVNLRLWPEPSANIVALCNALGQPWDETQIASRYFGSGNGTDRGRAVRQTFEVMAYEGLVIRDDHGEFRTTPLGEHVLSFLGLIGEKSFASVSNRVIGATPLIYGLSTLTEVRVIWALMRRLGNRLTNEELNRAMAAISDESQVDAVAELVAVSRIQQDPTLIGPRIYDADRYGTISENDQRKAMNPHFLFAGGGGMFIDLEGDQRRITPKACRAIDGALRLPRRSLHADTSTAASLRISAASLVN